MTHFDLPTALFASGLLFLLITLVVWATLHQRADGLTVQLWTGGAVLGALGMITMALRPHLPPWVAFELTIAALVGAILLRVMALRRHLQQPLRYRFHAALLLLIMVPYALLHRFGEVEVRVAYVAVCMASLIGLLTHWAWHASRVTGSRAARLLAFAELQSSAGTLIGGLLHLVSSPTPEPPANSAINMLWTASASIGALYGTLGYVGMVLDGLKAQQIADAQRAALAAERASEAALQHEAAERHARQLEVLLREQGQLTAEREQLLHVMAHEIRQPLHNASGVLQSLRMVDAMKALQPAELAKRAGRADAVLGQVRDVLDNVLTAAVLMNRREAPRMRPVDLSFLVDMALLDLPESQRPQVRVQQLDTVGPVQLEPHLFRLTLRNLLRNAFAHAGRGVQVVVSAQRNPETGHLRITVADDGQGIDPAKLRQLQQLASGSAPVDITTSGLVPHSGSRRGLGLQIVRQVVALHGGRLEIAARPGGGLAVSLDIPPAGA